MELDNIINKIISLNPEINRQEIIERIKNKKNKSGNFLTDETAARIIASDLGVKIVKPPIELKIQIKDLISGLNDVTLVVKLISFFPPKTFKRKDWSEGKFATLLVSDKTGTLRVVLWDKNVELIETGMIQKDQIIQISHGYVREGINGKPELHLGNKGKIKVLT
jgi:replication factor A1